MLRVERSLQIVAEPLNLIAVAGAGKSPPHIPAEELTLSQILQRMWGYNIVAFLNQFWTGAAFPGTCTTSAMLPCIDVP